MASDFPAFAELMARTSYKPISEAEQRDYVMSIRAKNSIDEWQALPWCKRLFWWVVR
jgi:hypothetical protein